MTIYDSGIDYDSGAYDGAIGAGTWVALGDLYFDGVADDNGVEWFVTSLEGWDSPEVRSGASPRPQDDGVWLASFFHGGRTLELKGHLIAPTRAAAFAAKNRLAAATNLLRSEALLSVGEDRVRQMLVRRHDRLLLSQIDEIVEFSVPLLAKDPRKYADENTVATGGVDETITFTNDGTVASRPIATVTGPLTVPVLHNLTFGETLGFDVTLDAGDTLAVDFDARTAVAAGVSYRAAVLPGSRWWSLGPSTNALRLTATSSGPGAGVTVTGRSAWI